jgi:hypothetical protein
MMGKLSVFSVQVFERVHLESKNYYKMIVDTTYLPSFSVFIMQKNSDETESSQNARTCPKTMKLGLFMKLQAYLAAYLGNFSRALILLYNFLFSCLFCLKVPFVCWPPPHNPLRTQNGYFYDL